MCLGIPGKIVSITNTDRQLGMVDIGGIQREINLSCIAETDTPLENYINDWVLVHVGFAMSRINEAEAQSTLQVLTELGEMQEELMAIRQGVA
ncbi:MAG: HypC/HybG/HupF family hydrogenase formation chaperone [Methylococcaceae bacterium]|nr:HypC/HybG/HupF family hydrogenase formation chaperone [Methylococcaceae bacterium]